MADGKYTESPSGGKRHENTYPVDAVKNSNSGLKEGGFYRPVQRFNNNGEMESPTTSAGSFKEKAQRIKPNRGFGGSIKP
jgi:hypothetical protein